MRVGRGVARGGEGLGVRRRPVSVRRFGGRWSSITPTVSVRE
jgi:hypothetical protein